MFIGSLLILALTYSFVGWIKAGSAARLFAVGLLWLRLTVLFEFSLGRLVLGLSWDRLTEDYDPSRGGLMPVGLLVMALAPLPMARVRYGWGRPLGAPRGRPRPVGDAVMTHPREVTRGQRLTLVEGLALVAAVAVGLALDRAYAPRYSRGPPRTSATGWRSSPSS